MTTAASRAYWHYFGGLVEDYGGAWAASLIGPTPKQTAPASLGPPWDLAHLVTWDHEPSVAEKDAVTPWDHREVCPACGVNGCDDEAHSDALWHAAASPD